MYNWVLKIVLDKNRGMIGELALDLYEQNLLAYPYSGLKDWSRFAKLRNLFK